MGPPARLPSCSAPPSFPLPILRQPLPAKLLERGTDAALLGGADAGRLDAEGLARNLAYQNLALSFEIDADVLLPRIGLVARRVLGHDVVALEILVWPPACARLESHHRFGEKLIPVARQRINIDDASPRRPEAASPSLVAQVCVAVGGADEDALPFFKYILATVTRSILLAA